MAYIINRMNMNLPQGVNDVNRAEFQTSGRRRSCAARCLSRFVIMALVAGRFMAPSPVLALDKRTPLDIVPYGGQTIQIISGYASQRIEQFTMSGSKVAEVESAAQALKLLYRATPIRRIEFAVEAPYVVQRYQRQTTPSGMTTYKYDSRGIGDVSVQATFQVFDHRDAGWGLIAGAELKMPTGDEAKGLGSGSYDVSGRATALAATRAGLPYAMVIYTRVGRGNLHGVRTDAGDDIYAAGGVRTPPWHSLTLDLRGGMYKRTADIVQESNGVPVYIEKHDYLLSLIEARYSSPGKSEVKLSYEALYPEKHHVVRNNITFVQDPGRRDQVVLMVSVFW